MSNFIKSVFISLFPVIGLSIFCYSIFSILDKEVLVQEIGLFIAGISVTLLFAFIFIFKRPRTSRLLLPYTLPVIIGSVLVYASLYFEKINSINQILSTILVLGQFTYLFWYSKFEDRAKNISLKKGAKLPELSFENDAGETISTRRFRGNYALYLFYRGNWCPLCMAQIEEIANEYKQLEERGVQTILVSPQPHKYTGNLAKKYNLGFHFLVDVKNKMAKRLHIDSKNGIPAGFQVFGYSSDTVLPTVIIADKTGTIIYSDQTDNYRIRPEPAEFLKVIDQHLSSLEN